ncbi:MAG TPA: SDR family oxidoreductase [Candidatus Omnitrophota bacterium]|nr:SDR family oxidoreductase [Candidatus Omnitrophota bacterium]
MKVLVTGGTGFIGSTLIRHLIAAGYAVRVLVRQKKVGFLLENLDVEIAEGDVTYPHAVEKAVQGCAVVFNLASLYAFYPFWMKAPKAIYEINVGGTVNMLAASLKYGVERFIHTSTIATINAGPRGSRVDETTGFDSRGASHYARSKYLAEQEVLKFCQRGLPAVILNPAIVIGERDLKPTPSGDVIVKFLNGNYPGYFETLWSVADADDIARAHIAAIRRGRTGERYILSNSEHHSMREIFRRLENLTGVKAPRFKIPYPLLLCFTYLEEAFSHFVLRRKPLMPTEGVKFCRMSLVYDNTKAVRELGFASTPFEETLGKAVSWYRKNAYIKPRGILRIKVQGSKTVRSLMRVLGINRFTDKLNAGTLIFFWTHKFLSLLHRAGVGRRADGWRTVTQSYLRTEQSKFALAVFGLDLWSDAKGERERTFISAKRHCRQRLAQFLKAYPVFRNRLWWHRFCAKERSGGPLDMVEAGFDGDGNLRLLEPYLDRDAGGDRFESMPVEVKNLLLGGIIRAYNESRNVDDKKRPLVLKKKWDRWLSKQMPNIPGPWGKLSAEYGERVISAAYIQFESLPSERSGQPSGRFQAPPFIQFKHPGYGVLNIVSRFTACYSEADLWIQFSHIPLDGVPAQEILNDLRKQWGTREGLRYPSAGYRAGMSPETCSTRSGRDEIAQVYQFLDFQPFLRVRSRLNRRFGRHVRQIVTSAALLIWKLAQYKEFEDVKFAIPVDLRATAERERTLGFIYIRPSIYFDPRKPDRGFFSFQREFNRQLLATRKRRSESYRLVESYAAASPLLFAATSKFLMRPLQEFVGTVGITIIKKADFFIAPSSDVHSGGFIAFSNYLLPSEDGGKICAVSIKGPRAKIQGYMNVLRDVVQRAIQHDELYF